MRLDDAPGYDRVGEAVSSVGKLAGRLEGELEVTDALLRKVGRQATQLEAVVANGLAKLQRGLIVKPELPHASVPPRLLTSSKTSSSLPVTLSP